MTILYFITFLGNSFAQPDTLDSTKEHSVDTIQLPTLSMLEKEEKEDNKKSAKKKSKILFGASFLC